MCKKLFALCCSVLLLCSMVFCLPASAYTAASDLFLKEGSSPVYFSGFSNDGLLILTTFYSSSLDPSVVTDPSKLDTISFRSGDVWQGSDTGSLQSRVICDQDVVGFSQSMSYSTVNSNFVYCLVTAIPVVAGDYFNLYFSPQSGVTAAGFRHGYFVPGATGIKRVYHSIESTAYTTLSDNQYFALCYNSETFPGSGYFGSTSTMSDKLVTGSSNLSFVRESSKGYWTTFVTPYGLSSGSDLSLTLADTVKDFSFSVFELFVDGTTLGGDINVEGDSSEDSDDSGTDISGVLSGIANLPAKIGEVFQGIINGLLDGIKTFFMDLFMPDTEAIAEEWEFIQSKFQFWVDVRDFVEEISASLAAMDGSTPDAIEFELKTSGTKWFVGLSGSAVVVDLSWFANYRDSVHVIISAFIWLAYIWRLFHALPGIIAGVQGSAPMDKDTARPISGGAATYDK